MDNYILINETLQFYKKYVEPNIKNNEFNKWKNPQILFTNDKFILIRDIKWKDNNINNLHLLAIPRNINIRSIRDLRRKDIKLLENIIKIGREFIKNNYKLSNEKINIYCHYHPGIWYFHIHFANINKTDDNIMEKLVCRTHYIDDIIKNLKIRDDYYKNNNIIICIKKSKLKTLMKNS